MKNQIIGWIGKHEKIHYIVRILRRLNDETYVREFLYPDESLFVLRVVSNGKKHKGKILYKVCRDSSGFFANFIFVLGDMWYADTMGMYPVVVWGEKCPYYEKSGVDGIFNAWEYYFEQYEDLRLEDFNSAFRVADTPKNVRRLAFGIENGYRLTEEYMLELGKIMKKYIRLNPFVKDYIEKKIKEKLGNKKTLGVQIRMGSMLMNCNEHPIVPSIGEYINEIRKIYRKGYEQIFLATDDKRALERIQKEFGGIVKYYSEITRVDDEYSTYCVSTTDELHNYKCGLEVLTDMYTLANCDGLVAGLSQVSITAQITKISFGESYKDLLMIDKGLNNNNKRALAGLEEPIIS